MNVERYEDLSSAASGELEELFPTVNQRLQARSIIDEQIGEMVKRREVHILTDEEEQMFLAFRRFKTKVRKAGEMFKWQTAPAPGDIMVLDGGLIQHPQDKSVPLIGGERRCKNLGE